MKDFAQMIPKLVSDLNKVGSGKKLFFIWLMRLALLMGTKCHHLLPTGALTVIFSR